MQLNPKMDFSMTITKISVSVLMGDWEVEIKIKSGSNDVSIAFLQASCVVLSDGLIRFQSKWEGVFIVDKHSNTQKKKYRIHKGKA